MPKTRAKTQIEKLRQLALAGHVQAFAEEIVPLLQNDFGHWLREMRVQKLLSQFRSKDKIRALKALISDAQHRARSFSEVDIKAISEHFEICEFFQGLFDYIDEETSALSCHAANRETFVRSVVKTIEMTNFGFHRNTMAAAISKGETTALQISQNARVLRDVLDAGLAILASELARGGLDVNYQLTNPELSQLFGLALKYDEVRQLLIFTPIKVSISGLTDIR